MRKNIASVVILGATAALSLSVVSSAIAATYPPVLKPVFNSDGLNIGTYKAPQKETVRANETKVSFTATVSKPLDVTLAGFKAGATVTSSVVIGGKTVKLPPLTTNAKGVLDTKALGFTKPGKYVITYKSGGVTKTVTITIKK